EDRDNRTAFEPHGTPAHRRAASPPALNRAARLRQPDQPTYGGTGTSSWREIVRTVPGLMARWRGIVGGRGARSAPVCVPRAVADEAATVLPKVALEVGALHEATV